MMKNLQIVFCSVLMFVLVHCGDKTDQTKEENPGKEKTEQGQQLEPQTTETQNTTVAIAPELASVECISGVYTGEIDIRWDWSVSGYDATVSLAFAGNSLLVKVKGDQDEVLCTRYDGITTSEKSLSLLTAQKITSSRFLVEDQPQDLAVSLNTPIWLYISENLCSFNVGSVVPPTSFSFFDDDNNSILGASLEKNENQQADFNTLLAECGGVEKFTHTLVDETK